MKVIGLLVLVLVLSGCSKLGFPGFPKDVKHLYAVVVTENGSKVNCAKYEILSHNPLSFLFLEFVDPLQCQGVSGFQPADFKKVQNWIEDAQEFAKTVRCKLK